MSNPTRAVIIGNESLATQCAGLWLQSGHHLAAIVTRNPDVKAWAKDQNIKTVDADSDDVEQVLQGLDFDWLLSIANLDLLPEAILKTARKGAVNFHDGPLPRYAGLNAPVWAILNGERQHGITWHKIEPGVDTGDILHQTLIDIAADETALSLNTKCYAAAIDSFPDLASMLTADQVIATPQDHDKRSYFGKNKRPDAAGLIDLSKSGDDIIRFVRALDHGAYFNPVTCAKLMFKDRLFAVGKAEHAESPDAGNNGPGTALAAGRGNITVTTGTTPIRFSNICALDGTVPELSEFTRIDPLSQGDADEAAHALAAVVGREADWRKKLETLNVPALPLVSEAAQTPQEPLAVTLACPASITDREIAAAFAVTLCKSAGATAMDFAFSPGSAPPIHSVICPWRPVKLTLDGPSLRHILDGFATELAEAEAFEGFAADLPLRCLGTARPTVGLTFDHAAKTPVEGTVLTLAVSKGKARLLAHPGAMNQAVLELYASRFSDMLRRLETGDDLSGVTAESLSIISQKEHAQLLADWAENPTPYDPDLCIHSQFEAQVRRTPDAEALAFEAQSFTYDELDRAANRVAHRLRDLGVDRGSVVGLHVKRGPNLLIGALAILKAGAAYVPLDPTYPKDRIALFIKDSQTPVILSESALSAELPAHGCAVLHVDDATIDTASEEPPASGVTGDDLAYLIFTSGSTGRPKGVMVEHRNVANFFAGMDQHIRHDPPGVWMAVTSLSFDISVLELFWTLARGFKIVLSGDENRTLVSGGGASGYTRAGQAMDFSLYYWGNDDGAGRDKYRLLLEGAKFADENGFCAVWTPERHFHAFGGPYPNPSVTGAAVAAVTKNLSVRAGSCVAPLHHPARIAEEWAVIDNLTNGRSGLAIASGWQPDDFILRPENTPPDNHKAMFDSIDTLRKLWAGEAVEFPRKDGQPHAVVTQPRPVSEKPSIWVTTAGNPETWKKAGQIGANVLTHLLGQSVDEVGEKITLYKQALRDAGYDPKEHTITLMLHSFVGYDRETVRAVAREPMKDYLRSAAGLIKQYAWAFPAFKRPKNVSNPFELDLGGLDEEELEGILDFAFERYFEESGLFGTVEDCVDRVEQLKQIGVTEIACLIDYGIDTNEVLNSLVPLAEVVRKSGSASDIDDDDYSIAAQILRHNVTHMQCTPSMARMLCMSDDARASLAGLDHLMIGGEAFPAALFEELRTATTATIQNMYGPTETTIWSTTKVMDGPADSAIVPIGGPIANNRIYVLDDDGAMQPIGIPGELWIGGDGVTRGYWNQPELTEERYHPDPFVPPDKVPPAGARMYRTGDLVRQREDGGLDFLGRIDQQVKLRGYRIELGEIEAAIERFSAVRQAVVVAREDTPGQTQLVGYVTLSAPLDEQALRQQLSKALPDFMVPVRFVTLDSFPQTPNRKVDRNALPAPQAKIIQPPPAPVATPKADTADVAAAISTIWRDILGVTDVSLKDNFFDLGGHSLLAVQAHRTIRDTMGVQKLRITDVFRFPTLGGLAARVSEHLGAPVENTQKARATAQRTTVNSNSENVGQSERSSAMQRRREMRNRRAKLTQR